MDSSSLEYKNDIKQFENEKKYITGNITFLVRHEYIGTKKVGELINEAILKSEGAAARV